MKKNHAAAVGLGDLPGEILNQILVRLPVISILRCAAVCKDWNSLIRNSAFVYHHRSSNPNNQQPSLLLRRCGEAPSTGGEIEESFTLYSDPDRLSSSSSTAISSPFTPRSHDPTSLRVFGSLHGLICLCDNYRTYGYIIYVWNPSLRRFIDLPSPTLTFRNMGNRIRPETTVSRMRRGYLKRVNNLFAVLGFGYDCRRNDYKVVRIVYPPQPTTCPRRAEVYALKERRWREVLHAEELLRSCDVPRLWTQCFVDGTIYWPAMVGCKSNYILAFDVNDEGFSRIELPKELPGAGESRLVSISETKVKGLLTVLYHTATSCEVLLMKGGGAVEDSWVRFCSVSIVDPTRDKVIGLCRDEKVLLQKDKAGDLTGLMGLGEEAELCLYDCKTQEIERLGLPGTGFRGRGASYAADYTESLVLLEPEFGAVSYRESKTGPVIRSVNFDLEDEHARWSLKRMTLCKWDSTSV
ncbi:unnamed protein product [Linum trigynum]|uniref:F-box domain-containing protein n=1 Tax=Linum trigynum TaxID=586398 RepID=A0AAV2GTL8_9ROSI